MYYLAPTLTERQAAGMTGKQLERLREDALTLLAVRKRRLDASPNDVLIRREWEEVQRLILSIGTEEKKRGPWRYSK